MISAIQELGKRKKEKETEDQGSNSRRKDSIKRVENLLTKKGIKAEELEPNNRNYKEAINNAEESEIIDVEDRIKDNIIMKYDEKNGSNVLGGGGQTNYTEQKVSTNTPYEGRWWGKK
jgi:hypothetical protein